MPLPYLSRSISSCFLFFVGVCLSSALMAGELGSTAFQKCQTLLQILIPDRDQIKEGSETKTPTMSPKRRKAFEALVRRFPWEHEVAPRQVVALAQQLTHLALGPTLPLREWTPFEWKAPSVEQRFLARKEIEDRIAEKILEIQKASPLKSMRWRDRFWNFVWSPVPQAIIFSSTVLGSLSGAENILLYVPPPLTREPSWIPSAADAKSGALNQAWIRRRRYSVVQSIGNLLIVTYYLTLLSSHSRVWIAEAQGQVIDTRNATMIQIITLERQEHETQAIPVAEREFELWLQHYEEANGPLSPDSVLYRTMKEKMLSIPAPREIISP